MFPSSSLTDDPSAIDNSTAMTILKKLTEEGIIQAGVIEDMLKESDPKSVTFLAATSK